MPRAAEITFPTTRHHAICGLTDRAQHHRIRSNKFPETPHHCMGPCPFCGWRLGAHIVLRCRHANLGRLGDWRCKPYPWGAIGGNSRVKVNQTRDALDWNAPRQPARRRCGPMLRCTSLVAYQWLCCLTVQAPRRKLRCKGWAQGKIEKPGRCRTAHPAHTVSG